jgi:hypothetical protein
MAVTASPETHARWRKNKIMKIGQFFLTIMGTGFYSLGQDKEWGQFVTVLA